MDEPILKIRGEVKEIGETKKVKTGFNRTSFVVKSNYKGQYNEFTLCHYHIDSFPFKFDKIYTFFCTVLGIRIKNPKTLEYYRFNALNVDSYVED